MNPNDHENELLEALLQEHRRTDREQEIQAIEAALTAKPKLAQKTKRKRYWPWAAGIAASATFAVAYYHHEKDETLKMAINEPTPSPISYSQVQSQVFDDSKVDTSVMKKPSAPSSSIPNSITTTVADGVRYDQSWQAERQSYFSYDGLVRDQNFEPPIDKNKFTLDPTLSGDRFGALIDPSWMNPLENALSTFSVDVDNASYSNLRRTILEGRPIQQDAVRIEECINAFDYNYAPPTNDDAFAVYQNIAACPWNEKNALLRVGIKGREIAQKQRPASNLVFLIDVSGSMQSQDKLPLVKESLKLLIEQLDERDSVSYVVYAGSEGMALPPTNLDEKGRVKALDALASLESGGSTNGAAGIKLAYDLAAKQFRKGGVNRVILCSDGDFNVGITNTTQLVSLVKERAAANIYLSVLSFGTGNLNDEMLESISRDGNGNHYYIDGMKEARRVFLQKLSGTLITIAKDVKLQLEFNPARVKSYRLIGYANRVLRNEDFDNDRVDAGDIGAGHEVTAFYEIVPNDGTVETPSTELKYQANEKKSAPVEPTTAKFEDEWLTLKLRHKHPEGDKSSKQEHVLRGEIKSLKETDSDFRFAASVAMTGMKLRNDSNVEGVSWEQIQGLASNSLGKDPDELRAEFLDLLRKISQ